MKHNRIGLIQIDGKLPNLALMKISTFYKSQGYDVEFAWPLGQYDQVFASVLFTWNRDKAEQICQRYDNVEIGGTGWSLTKTLPPEIEACKPDYDLYTVEMLTPNLKRGIKKANTAIEKAQEIIDMGIGFTSRGCVRSCGFCVVKAKEGELRQDSKIADLINPRSNKITLYDNNLPADPECLDKLAEIQERGLIVDISQGIDVRKMTEEIAISLGKTRFMRSLHYAWDLMPFEASVLSGIKLLSQHVKPWRHMCFVLCGYDTTHEEDMYRAMKLESLGVSPYIMKYNNRSDDLWLNHFARWINGRIYKTCQFDEYTAWIKAQAKAVS